MKITHVPYKGVAPAVNDLVAGHIDGMVDNTPVVMAHIRSGAVTPLAIAAKNRIPVLPAVPTSAEAGLPEWQAPSSWFGLMAPAKTPPAIIKKLSEEVAKAVRQPSMQRFVADFGVTLVGNTPDEFAKFIAEERVRWGEIVRATAAQAN
jgi:tripartite-type tricarboxylate transporter receptor subunit TctC